MANRKVLIESILGLAQKIGANPSKFMGTKGNISFLGTGDRAMKDTTFSGALNKNFLELGVTKDDLIKVIEKDAGYVTADKLNDMQLKTMYDNLTMVDSKINPIQNIVKFPEGGINSIPINKQFSGEGITSLKNIEKSGGAGGSAPLTETLTKNETKYLNELIGDTGGGQFTSDIMEEVPSLRIKGNKINVDKKDIDSFKNYLDDLYISELAPSGPGANFMPPRLRAQTADNDLLIKLLRSEKTDFADGGRIGYSGGGIDKNINSYKIPELPKNLLEEMQKQLDKNNKLKKEYEQRIKDAPTQEAAEGGRIGYRSGKSVTDIQLKEMLNAEPPFNASDYTGRAADYKKSPFAIPDNFLEKIMEYLKRDKKANGGRIGYRSGKKVKGGLARILEM